MQLIIDQNPLCHSRLNELGPKPEIYIKIANKMRDEWPTFLAFKSIIRIGIDGEALRDEKHSLIQSLLTSST